MQESTQNNNELCKGCATLRRCDNISIVIYKGVEYKCPCVDCLLKCLCKIACPPFHQFRRDMYEYYDKQQNHP